MPTTLKALFRVAGGPHGGDLIDQAIVLATGGPEVHVEALIVEDPLTCFSAHLQTGVRISTYLGDNIAAWYGLDTGMEVTPEALEWAAAECGQPYNLLEAIISGFRCGAPRDLQPLFCSQAFAEVYERCGGELGLKKPNPHVLAGRLIEIGAQRMECLPSGLFTLPL